MIGRQVPAVCCSALIGRSCLTVGCDWSEMFGSVKKMISGKRQQPPPTTDPVPWPRPQRRPPSTPPLPLRTLQLVAKQPETPVVLRDRRKVKGHVSSVRESWPGAGPVTSEPKTRTSQKLLAITEARPNQPQPHVTPSAPHPHWSVPVRAPASGRGSEATMTSLLLLCHR